eukprot:CAMPEP_0114228922 /NCGR_PEP_ID=MMETSP0058-20121206/2618_1 /TAXON_ID=36894 /ORGANISM="Pyramimonas parkeae, CCMP726" /LENGTH=128 /DNA_ID=CAMNT_0001339935 /DNA_START=501 /DNA_END=884 /DNA_ORIENTATION=+
MSQFPPPHSSGAVLFACDPGGVDFITHIGAWEWGRDPTNRVSGTIDMKASQIKKALWDGGCGRGGEMSTGKRKLIPCAEDLVLIYAGQTMADDLPLRDYHVPPGCKTMIAIDKRKILAGRPDADSAYW